MNIHLHTMNDVKIAEIISDEIVIKTTQDAIDILGNCYYQGADSIIMHKKNITPDFFELKNKIAGEILQKFSNYRVRLVVVEDTSTYTSKSLRSFIVESNKGKQVNFLNSTSDALQALSS